MKALRIFFLVFLLLAGGAFFYLKVTRPILPVQRTIVNSSGKLLDVLVQGKLGETLYVDRVSDGERFEIQIPTLSLQDRFFAMRLEEGAPPSVVVEKVVDPFIASRTKQIAELKDKEILLKQEIKSGTLSGILAAKRKEDLAATIEDLKKLELAIQDYKYRNRKK